MGSSPNGVLPPVGEETQEKSGRRRPCARCTCSSAGSICTGRRSHSAAGGRCDAAADGAAAVGRDGDCSIVRCNRLATMGRSKQGSANSSSTLLSTSTASNAGAAAVKVGTVAAGKLTPEMNWGSQLQHFVRRRGNAGLLSRLGTVPRVLGKSLSCRCLLR